MDSFEIINLVTQDRRAPLQEELDRKKEQLVRERTSHFGAGTSDHDIFMLNLDHDYLGSAKVAEALSMRTQQNLPYLFQAKNIYGARDYLKRDQTVKEKYKKKIL